MSRVIISCIVLFTLLCSCGNDPRDHIRKIESGIGFSNDAETTADFWINEQSVVKNEKAHSGTHVSELDSTAQGSFSLGLRRGLEAISKNEIGSVIISAWVYVDSIPQPFAGLSLVASVNNDSKNVYYKGIPIEDSINQSKKWFFISREIPMKFEQKGGDVFTGYVLNNTKTKILVDDITFRFIEK